MIMQGNMALAHVKHLLAKTLLPTLCSCALALSGCVSTDGGSVVVVELCEAERRRPPVEYASSIADDTLSVAATFEKIDTRLPIYVTGQNFLGDACTEAKFDGRKIIGRELSKAVNANFRHPAPGELPLLTVKITLSRASVRRKSNGVVSVSIRGFAEIRNFEKPDEIGYSDDIGIERNGSASELNAGTVPEVFYEAAEAFAQEFVRRWSVAGIAHLKLDSWRRKCDQSVVKTPELENGVSWREDLCKNELVAGECVVVCNDYDYARAKAWAKANIANSCRDRLGGLEFSRLRIVHDAEIFDAKSKRITLKFHAFSRLPYVYQYRDINESGFITGDLELLGLDFEAAKDRLKAVVKSELEKGRTKVEFGNVVTDKTFNLLTYQFKVNHF